jgi:hypothetical protein
VRRERGRLRRQRPLRSRRRTPATATLGQLRRSERRLQSPTARCASTPPRASATTRAPCTSCPSSRPGTAISDRRLRSAAGLAQDRQVPRPRDRPEAPLPVVFLDATRYRTALLPAQAGLRSRCSRASAYADYQQPSSTRRAEPQAWSPATIVRAHRRRPRGAPSASPSRPPTTAGELLERGRGLQRSPASCSDRFGTSASSASSRAAPPRRPSRLGLAGPARQAVVLGGDTGERRLRGLRQRRRLRPRAPLQQPNRSAHRLRQLRLAGHPRARVGAHRPASASWPASSPAARQDVLSHLNVLAAQPRHPQRLRRRPARRLRRLTTASWCACSASPEALQRSSRPTLAEAEAFWAEHRPSVADRAPCPTRPYLELRSTSTPSRPPPPSERGLAIGSLRR